MLDRHVGKVLERIGPDDRVLDVGGWARCFNRADTVIDKFSYETRGQAYNDRLGIGPQGGSEERFSRERWICRDLCDREPWPFPDRWFDYCTCSHTLEDLRDPLWVCSEIQRVAKAGYIECPSLAFELTRGREACVPVGLSHHLWLVEVEDQTITFLPKLHNLHGDPALSLPAEVGATLSEADQVTSLFWEDQFEFKEGWPHRHLIEAFVHELIKASTVTVSEDQTVLENQKLFELKKSNHELMGKLWEASEELAYSKQQWEGTQGMLGAVQGQLNDALRALHESNQQAECFANAMREVRVRLDQVEGLGPSSLRIARGIQKAAVRHPRLASLARLVLNRPRS